MQAWTVGSRRIGVGAPCFVIAEAGSNHNGSLEQAMALVDLAAEAGADGVKFQAFTARNLYPPTAGASAYLGTPRSIYDIVNQMELPRAWLPLLADRCRERNLEFLVTAFDEESADVVDPFVRVSKIASYELTHAPLVRHVARKGKPVILSTGSADLVEVRAAVEWIRETGNDQIVLLQCTAKYPAPLESVNLRALLTMHEATRLPVGLSDHSREVSIAPCAAVALGACVVEKHVTLSNRLPGPDHRFAIEPGELVRLVRDIRDTERALGHGRKEMLPAEEELHEFARRSVFATAPIAAGERLTRENAAVLRNADLGHGAAPEQFDAMLGKHARRDLAVHTPIQFEDVG